VIGSDLVAKAPANGHTLLVNIPLLLQSSALLSNLPYDPLRDLVPVTTLVSAPLWLAVSTARVSASSLPEFIEQAKRAAQPLEFASFGNGSTPHLYGFRLTEASGLNLVHIPYKGGAPAVMALMGGEIALMFSDYVSLQPHLASGKVKIIAVTGVRRSRLTPQIPTMAELGYTGFESVGWGGVFAPAKTPPQTVQQLAAAVAGAVRDPLVTAKLIEMGYEPGGMPTAEFTSQVKTDHAHWTDLIRRTGSRLD
jgi:tripartite-type tricarboxylate transporter receptor subunit TctC